jgi:hypothetical protein
MFVSPLPNQDFKMPSLVHRMLLVSLSAAVVATAGCNDSPQSAPASGSAEHDHDHESGHEHGEHAHPTEGPHHGMLVELGNEEFHAEVVHDDAAGALTIYLLDSTATNPVTSDVAEVTINVKLGDKPMQFKLAGKASEANGEGKYSEYSLASKELLDALHEEASVARLSLSINGQPYTGEISHDDHAEHDHKH